MFSYPTLCEGILMVTDTREKLLEVKYFLERMIETHTERNAFKCNLGAFLSSARSVTWIMQKEFGKVPGFANWYTAQQSKMKADAKMKILDDQRDVTIHQKSISPRAHVNISITEHITVTDSVSVLIIRADGTVERRNSMPPSPPTPPSKTEAMVEWRWYFNEIPDMDVITVCKEHTSKLESIVTECERLFGSS
jgi:hypothetical protein